MHRVILFLSLLIGAAFSSQGCFPIDGQEGMWFTVDGTNYPCATTTRYGSVGKTSCGCDSSDAWTYTMLNAASSSSLYGTGWCGTGCGLCYAITPTGGFIDSVGSAPFNVDTQYVLVSNWCPDDYWCNSPNNFGYTAHFDLLDQDMNGLYAAMGWNNIEVYYQQVACNPDQASSYNQCECASL